MRDRRYSSVAEGRTPARGRISMVAALVALGALAGCSSSGSNDVEALALAAQPEQPDVLYNQGLANLEGGRLSEASAKFRAIDRQHPYTEWSRRALVMSAFASYRSGDFDEATTSAQRYVSLYPDSEEAAYAQYIMGLAYFRQMADVTRDQRATAQAATAMRAVFENYPDSEYAEDARAKLRIARDQLAGKEMQVGRYYLERREYLAAVSRFKNVVEVYPESRQVEEALYRLTEAYYAMGLVREAQAAASVLGQNYPDSQWYSDAYALLQGGGLTPQQGAGDSWFASAARAITGRG